LKVLNQGCKESDDTSKTKSMASQRAGKAAISDNILASIVVPAYKEGANLKELVQRVFAAFDKAASAKIQRQNVELIVVDDNSRDGSQETIEQLAREGYQCRIIVRTTERGLSSAVLRGFQESRGELLLCMDADLQVCFCSLFSLLFFLLCLID
jgi:dolichol-phosphate mannosyltransferase